MKTPTIKDLSLNEEMDSNAMATKQGGRMKIRTIPALPAAPSSIDPIGPWNDFILPND